MANEIRLDKQAGEAFKKKLRQACGYFEDEERSLEKAERLAGSLHYAQMNTTIRQAKKGTADTLKRLETFQKEYEEYERAIEDFDRDEARLLNNILYPYNI